MNKLVLVYNLSLFLWHKLFEINQGTCVCCVTLLCYNMHFSHFQILVVNKPSCINGIFQERLQEGHRWWIWPGFGKTIGEVRGLGQIGHLMLCAVGYPTISTLKSDVTWWHAWYSRHVQYAFTNIVYRCTCSMYLQKFQGSSYHNLICSYTVRIYTFKPLWSLHTMEQWAHTPTSMPWEIQQPYRRPLRPKVRWRWCNLYFEFGTRKLWEELKLT